MEGIARAVQGSGKRQRQIVDQDINRGLAIAAFGPSKDISERSSSSANRQGQEVFS
jgi:hypothetical protein